jgi:hypothetical protein
VVVFAAVFAQAAVAQSALSAVPPDVLPAWELEPGVSQDGLQVRVAAMVAHLVVSQSDPGAALPVPDDSSAVHLVSSPVVHSDASLDDPQVSPPADCLAVRLADGRC